MAKVGGGVNPMHLSNTAHPFGSAKGMKATSKFANSSGAHPTAAGSVGKFQTANAQMKAKKPLNGPGKA